jgi:S-adenosyl-L-methionine hydrolase (adenosine-forming)
MTGSLFLVTDFGLGGPYVGQVHAAVRLVDASIRPIDLMHDMPAMRPDLAAYLLPAICRDLPRDAVIVAVVDPGVGGDRLPLLVEVEGRRYVGPDNGLLSRLEGERRVSRIDWRPPILSRTFHGRDLFAPVGARLACGLPVDLSPVSVPVLVGDDWADWLARVVYIDGFGNAMLGVPGRCMDSAQKVIVSGTALSCAGRFGAVAEGEAFWYPNSSGMVEIAVNGGSAAERFSLAIGDPVLLQ